MKKHYIEHDDIAGIYFSSCGIMRARLEPKAETTKKSKVTCENCKRALRRSK